MPGSSSSLAREPSSVSAQVPSRDEGSQTRRAPLLAAIPAAVWLVAFFAIPLLLFAVYSVLTSTLYEVALPVTVEPYREALSDPINRKLAWNSFLIGLLTATVTVLIGLPIAYWLRFVAQRSRLTVLFLIIASMFASYLVRIYAWRTVLGSNGLINDGLIRLGIIDQPLDFLLFNRFAVTVALVHIFLPYVVLVLYASMAPMSSNLLELGQDLGAGPSLIWRRVILPIMAAPMVSSFVFVFILSASDYVTPQFLGGTQGQTLGVRIQTNFVQLGNWPEAAATSFIMLGAFLLLFLALQALLRWRGLNDLRLQS